MKKKSSYNGFPTITAKNWFEVRNQFKKTFPKMVTPENMMKYLNIKSPHSVNSNVVVSLKQMGILDEVGVPTELAVKWRSDEEYPAVCNTILESVYPRDLLSLTANSGFSRTDAENWFIQKGFGQETARKMARVFLMLLDANPKSGKIKKGKRAYSGKGNDGTTFNKATAAQGRDTSDPHEPTVHIDLQIHISPESTPEQIDNIFSSLAKHIYRKGKE